jgi:hypothetical protein
MRIPLLSQILFAVVLCFSSVGRAAVIQTPGLISVDGSLNGSSGSPFEPSDTLDYLKFEVLTTSSITVTSGFNSAYHLLLAQFIGRNDEFGFIGNPFILNQISRTEWDTLTRILDPGIYVAVVGLRENTSYDTFDGFVAVNPEGGGFTNGPYAYSISGEVRALEFWDGELDGTFIITSIPEPSTAAYVASSALLLWRRNANTRKENKALQRIARGLLVSTLHLIRKCFGFGKARPRP